MNRLKKILLSFVLPFFCLFISVSYAEFSSTPITKSSAFSGSSNIGSNSCGGYTFKQIKQITYNRFVNGGDDYISVFDTMVSSLTERNIKFLVIEPKTSDNSYLIFIGNTNTSFGGYSDINGNLNLFFTRIDTSITSGEVNRVYRIPVNDSTNTYATSVLIDGSPEFGYEYNLNYTIVYSNVDIKKIVWSGGATWDGTTYYYTTDQNTPTNPDEPIMPTNSEIAQAVQAFYNSDYYKNNKEFEDFIVLYSYKTGYFSFIGHNFGIDLGQVIVPPNYEYEGHSYNQDWWKFFLRNISAEISSNLWNRYYWLYSTNDFGENIAYSGKGSIKDLINLHFSTNSIIVYSTTDYPVVKIETNEETGVLEPVEGTIPGDQYTYDETLDPTTNEYNPIKDYIPTDPTQSILGEIDFDEINKVFEENKNILNIENASWLFSANNQLINYFIGFLSFLIVLIIISRLLGG